MVDNSVIQIEIAKPSNDAHDFTIKEALKRSKLDIDAELEALLAQQQTRIKIAG